MRSNIDTRYKKPKINHVPSMWRCHRVLHLTLWNDQMSGSAGLRTHVYHGKSKAWTGQELAKFGVVLTTYATMGLEATPRLHAKKGATGIS